MKSFEIQFSIEINIYWIARPFCQYFKRVKYRCHAYPIWEPSSVIGFQLHSSYILPALIISSFEFKFIDFLPCRPTAARRPPSVLYLRQTMLLLAAPVVQREVVRLLCFTHLPPFFAVCHFSSGACTFLFSASVSIDGKIPRKRWENDNQECGFITLCSSGEARFASRQSTRPE